MTIPLILKNDFGITPHKIISLSSSLALKFIYIAFASSTFVYILFQKKLLSKPISKIVSKLFFLPTFPITVLMRYGNYWTNIDDTVILGCAPMGFLNHPSELYKLGVRGVVNMCSEYDGPKGHYAELGMRQLHLPTVDHFEPTSSQMSEAVKFIQGYTDKGEKVYIHCKAGHGRAASIALCWLMTQSPTTSPKDLNALLRSKRKVRGNMHEQKNIQDFYGTIKIKK